MAATENIDVPVENNDYKVQEAFISEEKGTTQDVITQGVKEEPGTSKPKRIQVGEKVSESSDNGTFKDNTGYETAIKETETKSTKNDVSEDINAADNSEAMECESYPEVNLQTDKSFKGETNQEDNTGTEIPERIDETLHADGDGITLEDLKAVDEVCSEEMDVSGKNDDNADKSEKEKADAKRKNKKNPKGKFHVFIYPVSQQDLSTHESEIMSFSSSFAFCAVSAIGKQKKGAVLAKLIDGTHWDQAQSWTNKVTFKDGTKPKLSRAGVKARRSRFQYTLSQVVKLSSVGGEETVSVFVNNIPQSTRLEMLHFLYPSARSIQLPVGTESTIHGYAIVEFSSLEEARHVVWKNKQYKCKIGDNYLKLHVISHDETQESAKKETKGDKTVKNPPNKKTVKRNKSKEDGATDKSNKAPSTKVSPLNRKANDKSVGEKRKQVPVFSPNPPSKKMKHEADQNRSPQSGNKQQNVNKKNGQVMSQNQNDEGDLNSQRATKKKNKNQRKRLRAKLNKANASMDTGQTDGPVNSDPKAIQPGHNVTNKAAASKNTGQTGAVVKRDPKAIQSGHNVTNKAVASKNTGQTGAVVKRDPKDIQPGHNVRNKAVALKNTRIRGALVDQKAIQPAHNVSNKGQKSNLVPRQKAETLNPPITNQREKKRRTKKGKAQNANVQDTVSRLGSSEGNLHTARMSKYARTNYSQNSSFGSSRQMRNFSRTNSSPMNRFSGQAMRTGSSPSMSSFKQNTGFSSRTQPSKSAYSRMASNFRGSTYNTERSLGIRSMGNSFVSQPLTIHKPFGLSASSYGQDTFGSPRSYSSRTHGSYSTGTPRSYTTIAPGSYNTATPGSYSSGTPERYNTGTLGSFNTETPGSYNTETPGSYYNATLGSYSTGTPVAYNTETSGTYNTGTPGGYNTETSGAYNTETSGGYNTGNTGEYNTGYTGEYNTGTTGGYNTGTTGGYNTETTGGYNTETTGAYNTGTSGAYNTGTAGGYNTGTSGAYNTGTPGAYNTGSAGSDPSYSGITEPYTNTASFGAYNSGRQGSSYYAGTHDDTYSHTGITEPYNSGNIEVPYNAGPDGSMADTGSATAKMAPEYNRAQPSAYVSDPYNRDLRDIPLPSMTNQAQNAAPYSKDQSNYSSTDTNFQKPARKFGAKNSSNAMPTSSSFQASHPPLNGALQAVASGTANPGQVRNLIQQLNKYEKTLTGQNKKGDKYNQGQKHGQQTGNMAPLFDKMPQVKMRFCPITKPPMSFGVNSPGRFSTLPPAHNKVKQWS